MLEDFSKILLLLSQSCPVYFPVFFLAWDQWSTCFSPSFILSSNHTVKLYLDLLELDQCLNKIDMSVKDFFLELSAWT